MTFLTRSFFYFVTYRLILKKCFKRRMLNLMMNKLNVYHPEVFEIYKLKERITTVKQNSI
jgi:hypothetical protein